MKITFPPTFDINYYVSAHSELQGMPKEVVAEHYRRYAEKQGLSACIYDRSEYLKFFWENC